MLFLLFLLPPLEILLAFTMGKELGWGVLLGLWALAFAVGVILIRLRGVVFFKKAMDAARQGQMPTQAILGGIAWYVAGVLLMMPGVITDVLAALVLLPPVRAKVLARFQKAAEEKFMAMGGSFSSAQFDPSQFQWPPGMDPNSFGQGPQGDVFDGEAREVNENAPRVSREAPKDSQFKDIN